jgi:quinol monooxygenase YgiN
MAGSLLVVHVHVREAQGEAFRAASGQRRAEPARPGVIRFDLAKRRPSPLRPGRVYPDAAAAAAHKETAHYAAWRDTVADLMAEPRRSTKYVNVSPGDEGWASDLEALEDGLPKAGRTLRTSLLTVTRYLRCCPPASRNA